MIVIAMTGHDCYTHNFTHDCYGNDGPLSLLTFMISWSIRDMTITALLHDIIYSKNGDMICSPDSTYIPLHFEQRQFISKKTFKIYNPID